MRKSTSYFTELDVAETVCTTLQTCAIAPSPCRFGCDAEQREPDGGFEDTAVLRPFDDVLLCGLRRDRPFQRGQAHDGRGFQQHVAHSRHSRIRVPLRTGTTLNGPAMFAWSGLGKIVDIPHLLCLITSSSPKVSEKNPRRSGTGPGLGLYRARV